MTVDSSQGEYEKIIILRIRVDVIHNMICSWLYEGGGGPCVIICLGTLVFWVTMRVL